MHSHTHNWEPFRVSSQSNMSVFKMWENSGVVVENTGSGRAFTFAILYAWYPLQQCCFIPLNIKCFEKPQMHVMQYSVHGNPFKLCLICLRWKKNNACHYLHALLSNVLHLW